MFLFSVMGIDEVYQATFVRCFGESHQSWHTLWHSYIIEYGGTMLYLRENRANTCD